ncbi:MAG: tRNA (adenosine(37)-N6)-threonylcarbamoyltransferase complex dimerization subunit type 1 TsaB [Methylobacter sp.]|nr:MAG: tRNA (adenosine(37)-N6)-threonylcarbamoyltransferase complex dimerization subunit type 1 TsaB [Methylobacter sp.]
MKLLAVETATEACSAALIIDGDVRERYQLAAKEHTKLILPMVDELMAEAGLSPTQLDAMAFGCGPGSFTGVRIATGVAHGIALGADLPVVAVSTLAALAQDYFSRHPAWVALTGMDARMHEVFWGVYQKNATGFAELVGREAVTPAEQVIFPDLKGAGVGSAWRVYQDTLNRRLGDRVEHIEAEVWPRAGAIAVLAAESVRLGLAVPVEHAQPVYLRDKVAQTEAERHA